MQVLTDHKNLEPFMKTKRLNHRQARWSEFLSRYDFIVKFLPATKNGNVDAMTRRAGDLPREGDERLAHQIQTILIPKNLEIHALTQATVTLEQNSSLETQIIKRM